MLFANARGGAGQTAGAEYPAVTITLSKRKGTNATDISERVLDKINALRGYVLPNDLNITVTRNYGETAKDKSDELLKHLLIATLSVTLLIALALGWRESGVVLLAVPVTLALTLAVFYLYGYTLNRVTLFALIFSIGILGRRRHRCRREHRASFPVAGKPRAILIRSRGRGRRRSWQSYDSCHVRGNRRHLADGLRARPDGSIHAPDSRGSIGSHVVFA